MLKYLYSQLVFTEIPDEMSLAIAISGCEIRCSGCHMRELWEDNGEPLDIRHIEALLDANKGTTCLLLLGGERDIDALTNLFMYFHRKIKTAWYSGLDRLPKDKHGILQFLDFYKEGHFDYELGGLDSPTTNQKLYHITHPKEKLWDITKMLQRNGLSETTHSERLDKMP